MPIYNAKGLSVTRTIGTRYSFPMQILFISQQVGSQGISKDCEDYQIQEFGRGAELYAEEPLSSRQDACAGVCMNAQQWRAAHSKKYCFQAEHCRKSAIVLGTPSEKLNFRRLCR